MSHKSLEGKSKISSVTKKRVGIYDYLGKIKVLLTLQEISWINNTKNEGIRQCSQSR